MGLIQILLIADGAPYVEDTWWEGLLAILVGVLVIVALSAVVVGTRWLLGLEGARSTGGRREP